MKHPDWTEIDEILDNENLPNLIIEKVDFLNLMNELNLQYVGFGSKFKLRCPFHANGEERTPSCSVDLDKRSFHCYACQKNGSVINFVMLFFGSPYREALNWLVNFGKIGSLENIEFKPKKIRSPEETPDFQALKIANLLRENLKNNKYQERWQTWTLERFRKLDVLLRNSAYNEWEKIAIYYERLKKIIEDKK